MTSKVLPAFEVEGLTAFTHACETPGGTPVPAASAHTGLVYSEEQRHLQLAFPCSAASAELALPSPLLVLLVAQGARFAFRGRHEGA